MHGRAGTLILARPTLKRPTDHLDYDERQAVPHRQRTSEGFLRQTAWFQSISAASPAAPHADLVWCETGVPDIGFAREFAQLSWRLPALPSPTARRPSTKKPQRFPKSPPSRKNCRLGYGIGCRGWHPMSNCGSSTFQFTHATPAKA